MKDKLNIEGLFKEKFNSFEGEVNPSAWANIQQGMSATSVGTATATGMSLLVKTVIISGGIVAATFGGIYLFSGAEIENADINPISINNNTVENELTFTENTFETIDNNNINTESQNINTVGVENNNDDFNTEIDNSLTIGSSVSNLVDTNIDLDTDEVEVIAPDYVADTKKNDTENEQETGIDKSPIGSISFIEGDEYAPSTYTFSANPENYSVVSWEFEDGSIIEGETIEYTFNKPGTYKVKLTIFGKGDIYEEYKKIVIQSKASIDVLANIISPNGDRINDFFVVKTTEIESLYITIRDLKGNVLFQSDDVNFRWFGTNLAGDLVPIGDYTYEFFARGFDGGEFRKAGFVKVIK